jgi:site-specific recombinase XerD
MKAKRNIPAMRLHKASGQAICWIAGRTYYLGSFGSQEANEKYHRLVAQYLTDPCFGIEKKDQSVSVAECVVAYLKHAQQKKVRGDEYSQICRASKPLVDLFGNHQARSFGVWEFEAYRNHWITKGSSRGYINKQCRRILDMVQWWVVQKFVDATVIVELRCVKPIQAGEYDCPDAKQIEPVADKIVEATIKHLPKVLVDMVRLHQLLGCRPGEICSFTPSLVNTSSDVWTIELTKHKNAWRKQKRVIYVGPKAQKILGPYLKRDKNAYCFSPREAMQQRLEVRESERTTAKCCGNRRGTNRVANPKLSIGDCYNAGSYGHAIAYACKKAEVPKWSPNQLRHAAATRLRDLEGIESASVILGHKHLPTTEIYAEASTRKALKVAKKHG